MYCEDKLNRKTAQLWLLSMAKKLHLPKLPNVDSEGPLSTIFVYLCDYNLQRPRRVGARFTGDDIKPDEHVQPQLSFDYDGKRDR